MSADNGKPKNLAVRPNNRKPFRKGTYEQVQERIEFVADMFARNPLTRRSAVKRAVKRKYNIEFRQCAEYIASAKALLLKQSKMPKHEALSIVVNALLKVIASGKNVVQAANTISEIYSLFPPRRTELTGQGGGPIKTVDETPLPKLSPERLRELVEMGRERGGDKEKDK